MRWPNGGPPRLYALIINETAVIYTFPRKQERTAFVVSRTPTYADGTYTFLTYIQQEK